MDTFLHACTAICHFCTIKTVHSSFQGGQHEGAFGLLGHVTGPPAHHFISLLSAASSTLLHAISCMTSMGTPALQGAPQGIKKLVRNAVARLKRRASPAEAARARAKRQKAILAKGAVVLPYLQ